MPSEAKSLIELKARKNVKAAAAPDTTQDQNNNAFNPANLGASAGGAARGEGGAAAAAGVLTAVDEDGEGTEEADLPGEFDYFSDGGGEDE